jgi:hypothetical protein
MHGHRRKWLSITALAGAVVVAGLMVVRRPAGAVTRENFVAKTTADYVAVCSTPETDPLYLAAMAFCLGYGVGAYHYYQEITASQDLKPTVCFPVPPPPRHEILKGFVTWAGSHSQYAQNVPVESLFRYLVETYPCKE